MEAGGSDYVAFFSRPKESLKWNIKECIHSFCEWQFSWRNQRILLSIDWNSLPFPILLSNDKLVKPFHDGLVSLKRDEGNQNSEYSVLEVQGQILIYHYFSSIAQRWLIFA